MTVLLATEERPVYSKFQAENDLHPATRLWCIRVDEGWRSWILCTGMYEWAADQLLERLRSTTARWNHE